MTAIGYTHFQAEVDRLKRERDEAREQANDWHDMEAVAADMYRNRADRLKRMVRIALRWRRESERYRRERDEARERADRAEAALAELRSLWSCEEPERLAALAQWRDATACGSGMPSVGAMLAFFRRGHHQLAVKCEAIEAATKEPDHA